MSSHKYSIEEGKELRIQFYEDEVFKIIVETIGLGVILQVNSGQCEVNGCELASTQEFVNHNVRITDIL